MNIQRFVIAGMMLLFWSSPAAALTREEAVSDFAQAGVYYQKGKYQKAAGLYQKIGNAGWESGTLFYNLGNSYFRQGEIGETVLNYERAALLIPRDEDLRHNRNFVYARANLSSKTVENIFQPTLLGHLDFYTFDEMAWIIYALFLLTAAAHILSRIFHWRRSLTAVILSGLLILMGMYLGGLIYRVEYYRNAAFIVEPSEAKFEPRQKAAAHFRLKEGSRVRILRTQGAWRKIQRPDGRMGWVPRENLEKI